MQINCLFFWDEITVPFSASHDSLTELAVIAKVKGNKTIVRANARNYTRPIESSTLYRDFFSVLSKSLFLDENVTY